MVIRLGDLCCECVCSFVFIRGKNCICYGSLAPLTLLRFFGYAGFGSPWEMQVIDGHLLRTKGGNIDGFSSSIAMVPEMRLGVIALVNGEVDGSQMSFTSLENLLPAFRAWIVAQQSNFKPNYPNLELSPFAKEPIG